VKYIQLCETAYRITVVVLLSVGCLAQVTVSKLDNPVTREHGVILSVDSADANYTYSVSCAIQGKQKKIVETIHSKDRLMFQPYQLPQLVLLAQPTSSISLQHFDKVWDKEQPIDVPETLTPDFQTLTEFTTSSRGRRWLLKQFATHSTLSVSLQRSGMARGEVVAFNIQGIAPELEKHDECKSK